ncbi:MAG: branched-chain amino acid ABC transporter permease [Lautropia sp.]
MDISNFLQLLFGGLTLGSVYALIALGLTMILNSTDVINVAQGEIVMIGGVVAVVLVRQAGLPMPLAIVLTVLLAAALGGIIYAATIDPVKDAPAMTLVMITLAGSMILSAAAGLLVGYDPMITPASASDQPVHFMGAAIAPQAIWILAVAAASMVALHQFYNRTRIGQAMLACNVDRQLATLMGINARAMVLGSFVVGAGFAGLAGALIVPLTSVNVLVGLTYTLKGFAAAVLGGLGNSMGAVIGGLALGMLEAFGGGVLSTGYRDFITLTIILLLLIVRPQGILGSRL